jgi:hypothetical protein
MFYDGLPPPGKGGMYRNIIAINAHGQSVHLSSAYAPTHRIEKNNHGRNAPIREI